MSETRYRTQAVVVGTGAGGAVAGAVLAEAGVDTILVERGRFYSTADHAEAAARGDIASALRDMYVNGGATIALGRPPIPIPIGKAVGGSTIINSGTCFRAPPEKVQAWGGPSVDEMAPYFEEVERRIHAEPTPVDRLGRNWDVLKRGCDALGIGIKPLVHNIKECQRSGRCAFGCPSGAKQSTDVTFVPDAIAAGAEVLAEHDVDEVLVAGGKAIGVAGTTPAGRFHIQADVVVLAMGALTGPAFMLRHRLANSSRRVGRGLRIHPGCRVVAEFEEVIDGYIGVPQGAYIDHWADQGIMMEGIFVPPGPMLASLPGAGFEFKALCALYRRLSAFGLMVADTKSGRVTVGRFGAPFLAWYQLGRADARSLHYGLARLAEIYFAAGAKRVFTSFGPMHVLNGEDDLARFEGLRAKPPHFELMAFHPLGTCAMGADPAASVVDFSLQTHDVRDLFIMDASVIPDSLGVNPQLTVMALAMRAARLLASRLT